MVSYTREDLRLSRRCGALNSANGPDRMFSNDMWPSWNYAAWTDTWKHLWVDTWDKTPTTISQKKIYKTREHYSGRDFGLYVDKSINNQSLQLGIRPMSKQLYCY